MFKNKMQKEVKVGLLVAVTAALFIVGLGYLRGRSLLARTTTLYADFDSVQALHNGSPVFYRGLNVGKVSEIVFTEVNAALRVTIEIPSDLSLPRDSRAIIRSSLLGGASLELMPGAQDTTLGDGDVLPGMVETGLMANLKEKLDPISHSTAAVLSTLDTITKSIKTVTSGQNLRMNAILANVERTSSNLSAATARVQPLLDRATRLITTINSVIDSIKNDENLRRSMANARTFTDTLAAASGQVRQLVANAQTAIRHIDNLSSRLDTSEAALGRLLLNPETLHNLQTSSANLDALLVDLRRNPHRYVHFSVFGRGNRRLEHENSEPR